jgi:hypothetical protein
MASSFVSSPTFLYSITRELTIRFTATKYQLVKYRSNSRQGLLQTRKYKLTGSKVIETVPDRPHWSEERNQTLVELDPQSARYGGAFFGFGHDLAQISRNYHQLRGEITMQQEFVTNSAALRMTLSTLHCYPKRMDQLAARQQAPDLI